MSYMRDAKAETLVVSRARKSVRFLDGTREWGEMTDVVT